jgi:two-component system, OmpR family, lantibiotic biosynthesis response regulator NisR/SpaR
MKKRILIVDDNADIVSFIRDYFIAENYEVLCAYDVAQALRQIKLVPDIVLLDVNLPDGNGFDFCESVREQVSCPIIFLTARIEDVDKLEGFAAGGDDYVTKPFNIDVLGARVASHLRREGRSANSGTRKVFQDILIDYAEKQVYKDDEAIVFTRKEFEIIALLSKNAGRIYDRERIYENIWGYDAVGESTSVTEHIKRIRNKLKQVSEHEFIDTVWGVGYRWLR